jgi:autophagy-related protein 18
MIPAHDSPLAALGFSASGTKVATASEKGTVIRVFLVHDGSKVPTSGNPYRVVLADTKA